MNKWMLLSYKIIYQNKQFKHVCVIAYLCLCISFSRSALSDQILEKRIKPIE